MQNELCDRRDECRDLEHELHNERDAHDTLKKKHEALQADHDTLQAKLVFPAEQDAADMEIPMDVDVHFGSGASAVDDDDDSDILPLPPFERAPSSRTLHRTATYASLRSFYLPC